MIKIATILCISLIVLSSIALSQVPLDLVPTSELPSGITLVSKEPKTVTQANMTVSGGIGIYNDSQDISYNLGIFQSPQGETDALWTYFTQQKSSTENVTTFEGHEGLAGVKEGFGYTISWKQKEFIIILGAASDVPQGKDNVMVLAELVEKNIVGYSMTPATPRQPAFEITFTLAALLAVAYLIRRRA